jgi:hypothetical protein
MKWAPNGIQSRNTNYLEIDMPQMGSLRKYMKPQFQTPGFLHQFADLTRVFNPEKQEHVFFGVAFSLRQHDYQSYHCGNWLI